MTTVVGLFGAIAFGIWLAILRDAFQVWDGWVIGAIVLWCVAAVALWRSFVEYAKPVAEGTGAGRLRRRPPRARS